MKTLFNTVLKSGSMAIILLASVFTLSASAATVTLEKSRFNPDIKKVIVKGNTQVKLVRSATESVAMDELDLDRVTVKQVGNTLTISSSESSPVLVFVYVKDIYRIDAADQSNVTTSGKFEMANLQILLKDDATARVKADTKSLYTVISDRAELKLIGNTDNHISQKSGLAKIDTGKFAALNSELVSPREGAVVLNGARKNIISRK
jgi:hypothetical protein